MKKYFIVLMGILTGCQSLKRQEASNKYIELRKFGYDTVAFIKYNFITHKDRYIGKETSVFLHDLQIPVRSFGPDLIHRKPFLNGFYFYFGNKEETVNRAFDPKMISINIKITTLEPDSTIINMIKRSNSDFSDEEKIYCGKFIVKDIIIPINPQ